MSDQPKKNLLSASEIQESPEHGISHPLNPRSEVYLRPLAEATGMQRAQVSLLRLPPGKEAFTYHSHQSEEEWIYILSGRGRTEIDGRTYEVGPGDFMGFPTPSVAHILQNPYEDDLVYLVGGERNPAEVAHFPKQGKYLLRAGANFFFADESKLEPVTMADFMVRKPAG